MLKSGHGLHLPMPSLHSAAAAFTAAAPEVPLAPLAIFGLADGDLALAELFQSAVAVATLLHFSAAVHHTGPAAMRALVPLAPRAHDTWPDSGIVDVICRHYLT